MTRLGLIARADNSGLGTQTWEIARHLQPAKTLVIDVGHLHDDHTHCNKATNLDRYPGAAIHRGWNPDRTVIDTFLEGLDIVLTCETPYSAALFDMARQRGIRSVLHYNFEFLDPSYQPDVLAAPSPWRIHDVPDATLMPMPVALDRFTPRPFQPAARQFLHIVGRPALHDRNGTTDLIAALPHVTAEITVTIKTQDRTFRVNAAVPDNVTLIIDRGDTPNYWDNYHEHDVLVMPRRFGGLCLPAHEAVAAGMPVIMPDVSPNSSWLPHRWLTAAQPCGRFTTKGRTIEYIRTDPHILAGALDAMAASAFPDHQQQARDLAHTISWPTLKPTWDQVIGL